jgi:hypothetical protein
MGAPMSDEIACRLTKQVCPFASIDPRRHSGPSLRRSLPTTARNLQFPPIDLIRKSRHRSADITGSHLAASAAWPRDITEPAFGEGKPGAYALTGRRQRREPDSPAAIDVPAVRPCWRWPGKRAPCPTLAAAQAATAAPCVMRSATPSQPAMTGAHAHGCALSSIAGKTRRAPTVANCSAPNLEGDADHGGVVFCDGKHPMGAGTLMLEHFPTAVNRWGIPESAWLWLRLRPG